MIRTTVPSSLRKGAALVGAVGVLAVTGCAADSDTGGSTEPAASYADGTYTAEGSYQTPETIETVTVTLTLADGVITEVDVVGDPQARETEQFQGQFIEGIDDEVVGVAIDDLDVSRVAGSSLTSGGFNSAVEDIKEQASA
jgi:uncharacterized protein with FMN-binding domain